VLYIFLIAVIGFLIFILFCMFKYRRGVSSSDFTPIDDLENGLIRKDSREPHQIEARNKGSYEERNKSALPPYL
jgi:hypothetical protein